MSNYLIITLAELFYSSLHGLSRRPRWNSRFFAETWGQS